MIEARQVRYGVRSREILRGVDFRVEEGEAYQRCREALP